MKPISPEKILKIKAKNEAKKLKRKQFEDLCVHVRSLDYLDTEVFFSNINLESFKSEYSKDNKNKPLNIIFQKAILNQIYVNGIVSDKDFRSKTICEVDKIRTNSTDLKSLIGSYRSNIKYRDHIEKINFTSLNKYFGKRTNEEYIKLIELKLENLPTRNEYIENEKEKFLKKISAKISSKPEVINDPVFITYQIYNELAYLYKSETGSKLENKGLIYFLEYLEADKKYIRSIKKELSDKSKEDIKRTIALDKDKKISLEGRYVSRINKYNQPLIDKLKKEIGRENYYTITTNKIEIFFKNPYIKIACNLKTVSLNTIAKHFDANYTKLKKSEIDKNQRIKEEQEKFGGSYVLNSKLPEVMNITATERDRWKADGRLIVGETRSFRKWGSINYYDIFYSSFLKTVTPEKISEWRTQDKLKRTVKGNNLTDDLISKIAQITKAGFIYNGKTWSKIIEIVYEGINLPYLVVSKVNPLDRKTVSIKTAINKLNESFENIKIDLITKKIDKIVSNIGILEEDKRLVVNSTVGKLKQLGNDLTDIKFKKCLEESYQLVCAEKIKNEINLSLNLEKYEFSYPLARSLNREISIIVGPTNSGKTYEAIESLKRANSGTYLAPLRLLAMEVYDKLNSEGVPCNLITGEEEIIKEGARHTASTIEMMNPNREVEVSIIDEFQMIEDVDRGSAWTSSMVGTPAKKVYLIGNRSGLQTAKDLFTDLNEKVEVIEKSRFNELSALKNPLEKINDLKGGDCVVAFSRQDVLTLATKIRDSGKKVSAIYGSLSPEVRRRQADRFLKGETSILVSTDAIGMGLNLPIKRIIYAALEKYDGYSLRPLYGTEFLQISGRAGRYGIHEKGEVGYLRLSDKKNNHINLIHQYIDKEVQETHQRLYVSPNSLHIETIAKSIKTKNIPDILKYFSDLKFSDKFSPSDFSKNNDIYDNIRTTIGTFSPSDQYFFTNAPINTKDLWLIQLYKEMIRAIKSNKAYDYENILEINCGYDTLEDLEHINKGLTLYCWLAHKYKTIFPMDKLPEIREHISKLTIRELTQHDSYRFSKNLSNHERIRREYWEEEEGYY